jgi:hypothetical protein
MWAETAAVAEEVLDWVHSSLASAPYLDWILASDAKSLPQSCQTRSGVVDWSCKEYKKIQK